MQYPVDHPVFAKLTSLLDSWSGVASRWCQSAEHIINTIYALCDHPDTLMEPIIRSMSRRVFGATASESDGIAADALSRLLFLVGHVALKELLQVEAMKLKQKRKRMEKQKAVDNGEVDEMEDELGVAEQNEALEDERWNQVVDHTLVCANLLGMFGPILQRVLLNEDDRYSVRTLQAVASLSLAKFMAVSDTFCTRNLQLLFTGSRNHCCVCASRSRRSSFTVLERSNDEMIRGNIVIALGDLSYRFPNRVEGWNQSIYARLQDPSNHVRKTAIMVLTHLILNGVIKIKNNGGLLAMAVIDEDLRIAEFSRQFFMKLALTDKGIYNALPDIVSSISQREPRLLEADFRKIMAFVFQFIEGETQNVSLIEKLCGRFDSTTQLEQWRDVAVCLSMLQYNERGIKKLYDCAAHFKDLCHDDTIYACFADIVTKSKKNKATQAATELQKMIDECYRKRNPGKDLPSGASAPKKIAAANKDGKTKRKRGGKGRGKAADGDADDGDDGSDGSDIDDELEELAEEAGEAAEADAGAPAPMEVDPPKVAPTKGGRKKAPARAKAAPKRKAAPRRRGKEADDDDEDELDGDEGVLTQPVKPPPRRRAAPIVEVDVDDRGGASEDDDSLSLHDDDD